MTIQQVLSEPRKQFKEKYLTKSGIIAMRTAISKKERKEIWAKYGKNRYVTNPNSKQIKEIIHD